MKQNEIDHIRHAMLCCQMRLKNLEPYSENSSNLSEIYNKVLIEKAVLRNQLVEQKITFLQKLFNKFFVKNEKKICDYFN